MLPTSFCQALNNFISLLLQYDMFDESTKTASSACSKWGNFSVHISVVSVNYILFYCHQYHNSHLFQQVLCIVFLLLFLNLQLRYIFKSAFGSTAVPISRPSITTLFFAASSCCISTISLLLVHKLLLH